MKYSEDMVGTIHWLDDIIRKYEVEEIDIKEINSQFARLLRWIPKWDYYNKSVQMSKWHAIEELKEAQTAFNNGWDVVLSLKTVRAILIKFNQIRPHHLKNTNPDNSIKLDIKDEPIISFIY